MNTCYIAQADGFTIGDAAVIFTTLAAVAFVCAYAATTRGAWRDSAVGVNVMVFMAAIAAVSALAVAGIIWGVDWPHRTLIRTAAWGSIGVCIWWRVAILFRVQRPLRAQPTGGAEGDQAVRPYPRRRPPA